MRHLLNTLFVLSPEAYIALENENVVIHKEDVIAGRFPLHTLEQIAYFGYKGASPALMGACAKREIGLSFFTPNGKFLARVCGITHGNVLLRKKQYRIADDEEASCLIARNFVVGKILNARSVIERAKRDHPMNLDLEKIKVVSRELFNAANYAICCKDLNILRGIEGEAAREYFSILNDLILQNKTEFYFDGRVKRPPLDKVNAMLSFVYTLLTHDCASALEGVGLDSYVGFMHRDRPGRSSLALDLMEELRNIYADRFVLTLINNRVITGKNFIQQESGAVLLTEAGRKSILTEWQNRKQDVITHPFLGEKIAWGLVPHVQALLLSRFLRDDLDGYPAFLWK